MYISRILMRISPKRPIKSVISIYFFLILANTLAWIWALKSFYQSPLLLNTAFLAWVFGLRHAVDADHIAAIDNVVRQFTQHKKPSLATGLWFALGHSSIVILFCLLVAAFANRFKTQIDEFQLIGGTLATLISGSFLLIIAFINFFIFLKIWKIFKDFRANKSYSIEDMDNILASRGFLSRILKPAFRMVSKEWHMLPLGFLFGLGFDTATEIGLLGIAAIQAAKGMATWDIMVFPLLFTCGMTLIDTTDSIVMTGAYNWAFKEPLRKLWYNLTMTGLSIFIATVIGGIEILGLLQEKFKLSGFFWDQVQKLQENLGSAGFIIISIFILCWISSFTIFHKFRKAT